MIHAPTTSIPHERVASARPPSCVAITSSFCIRSRQTNAVARCKASRVPSGVGNDSDALVKMGRWRRTRSTASSQSLTVASLNTASSIDNESCRRRRSIVRGHSTANISLEMRVSKDRKSSSEPGSRSICRSRTEESTYAITSMRGPRAIRSDCRLLWAAEEVDGGRAAFGLHVGSRAGCLDRKERSGRWACLGRARSQNVHGALSEAAC